MQKKGKIQAQDVQQPVKKKKLKLKMQYRRHFDYKLRLVFNCLVFLVSFGICLYFATKSFDFIDSKIINFSENNNIDYQVYVKPNDFYETDHLDKNMIYVASLIDKVNIDFNYNFEIDENYDLDFTYRVMGNLVIASAKGTKYFEKDYVIEEEKQTEMLNTNNYSINENVNIDYDYYNKLANEFKSSYGLDTNSYLKVYLEVNKKSKDPKLNINDNTTSELTIPLSERSIEIKIDSDDDSVVMKRAVADKEMVFNSKVFIIEVVFFFLAAIYIHKIIKLLWLLKKKISEYDVFLKKILKEYDRLIVETTTGIDYKNSHIIKIDKFNELLDVRDNLKLPIMYYNVVSHQKCYFYIKNEKDVYMMQLKASDMEYSKSA